MLSQAKFWTFYEAVTFNKIGENIMKAFHVILITLILTIAQTSMAQNYSLRFSTGEYAQIPNNGMFDGLTEYTFEIWYYHQSKTGQEEHIVGNDWFGDHIVFSVGILPKFLFNSNRLVTPLITDQWIHLAGVVNNDNVKFFVKGQLVDSCNNCAPFNFNSDITINHHTWDGPSESSRLTGKVDDLRISSVARPGFYKVVWDASEVGSGVYFYRLTTGSYSSVKKAILLK